MRTLVSDVSITITGIFYPSNNNVLYLGGICSEGNVTLVDGARSNEGI